MADDTEYITLPLSLTKRIDRIMETAKSSSGAVQSEADWKAVRLLFELFLQAYPDKALDLYKAVSYLKSQQNDHSFVKVNGDLKFQHQMEVPEKFYMFMKAVYPNQQWDTKFVTKFISVVPEVSVKI